MPTQTAEKWVTWAEWLAQELNWIFREYGRTGEYAQITAATVRHGERARG